MKKKHFFLPIVAALALTGCSNEDMPGQEPEPVTDGDGAFLAVNIVTPSSVNGRAVTENDFEDGKTDLHENDVNDALFLIFDVNGNLMNYQKPDLEWTDATSPLNPAVERISKAVLILDGAKKWEDSQILAILNYRGEEFWAVEGHTLTLDETLEKIADYSVTKFIPEGKTDPVNEFLMTNSVYNNAHGTVTAVPISGKVKTEKDKAEKDPVEIYVERVVAKVRTSAINAENFTITPTTEKIGTDEAETTFIPEIKGIEVANVAKTSYLLKNIAGLNFTWAWNDPANFRSYWANIPANLEYDNQSWTEINKVTPFDEQNFYIQENTVQDEIKKKTAVLITAQLKVGDKVAGDLIRYGGDYYWVDGYLKVIANQLKMNYAIKTVDEGTGTVTFSSILPDHLETFQDAAWDIWQVAPRLKDDAKALTFVDAHNHETVITADQINTYLKETQFRAWEWKDGMCYYYVYIDHFGTEEVNGETKKLQGIVRNHIYNLTLKDLKGLGVPVFDPDRDIIPDRPSDDSFFLAARVNILKWRLVDQNISFQ